MILAKFSSTKSTSTHRNATLVSDISALNPQMTKLAVDNNNVFSSKWNQGFAVFNWDNNLYYLISAPKTGTTNGTLFLYKEQI